MNKKIGVRMSLVLFFMIGLTALYLSHPNKSETRCSNCGYWAWTFYDRCWPDDDTCSATYVYPNVACCNTVSGSASTCSSASSATQVLWDALSGDCDDATKNTRTCNSTATCTNINFSSEWWESCTDIGTLNYLSRQVPHCI